MVETVRVTVAPGGHVTVKPHPSGIAALGSLTLYEGAVLAVTAGEADELYRRGDILHPMTGRAMPRSMEVTGPTISVNGSRPFPLSEHAGMAMHTQALQEAAIAHDAAQPPRRLEPAYNPGPPPDLRIWFEGKPYPARQPTS